MLTSFAALITSWCMPAFQPALTNGTPPVATNERRVTDAVVKRMQKQIAKGDQAIAEEPHLKRTIHSITYANKKLESENEKLRDDNARLEACLARFDNAAEDVRNVRARLMDFSLD
jgi:predicted RNase H-like nuclease (RuvC/YqgF family)